MKLLAVLALLVLALMCGWSSAVAREARLPAAPGSSPPQRAGCVPVHLASRTGATAAELRRLVPHGWTIGDWGVVDGHLLGVVTKRTARLGWAGDEEAAVSLYQRIGGVLVERNRTVFGWFGSNDQTLGEALGDDCAWRAEPAPVAAVSGDYFPADRVPRGIVPNGWRVVAAAWSKSGDHLVLRTRRSLDGAYAFGDQLSIYRLDRGSRPVEVWREVNMGQVELFEDFAFRDLNRDGLADVAYRTSCACNYWRRSGALAATIRPDGSVIDMPFVMPPGHPAPHGPEDIDGDGVYEWRVGDASWESKGFGHAYSPGSTFILAWDGQAYADASHRFGDAIVGRRSDPIEGEGTLSDFVGRFLDYYNAGRESDAQRMLAVIREFAADECTGMLRDAIVAALERDPHRSELSVSLRPPPHPQPANYCAYR